MYIKLYDSVQAIIADDQLVDYDAVHKLDLHRPVRSMHEVDSVDEIDKRLLTGWPEGERRAREMMRELEIPRTRTTRRRRVRGDFGDHLDIQRVYAGSLDTAWETTRREVELGSAGLHVTLLVNIGCLIHRSIDSLFWRGAAALLIADALEASSRRCEIIAYSWSQGSYRDGSNALTGITLKRFDQPLDTSTLIAATGFVGLVRWYVFRNRTLHTESLPDSGLGFTIDKVPPSNLLSLPTTRRVITVNNVYSYQDAQALLSSLKEQEMTHA